jgi:hypothetical protein
MTTAPRLDVPGVRLRAVGSPITAVTRLLVLESRRNAVLWMLPFIGVLFWFVVYRRTVALPASWSIRAMTMQTAAVSVFVPTVVAAAAWMGSREGRLGLRDLMVCTARPRFARQLATWAATTGWVLVAYVACVGALYVAIERQTTWGRPLWWPAAVGAASLPAFSAMGFVAGALRPSRFTAPLVSVTAFFAIEVSAQWIHGFGSYWQISPLVAGPWNVGPSEGLATFYPYLPDLPRVQLTFLIGLTAALMGLLGLPAGSGGRGLRRFAALITAAGLLTAGTAVALAGTGRLDAHGMIAIPAVHDAGADEPVPYTPVCSSVSTVPVCLHPAYATYLPAVTAALQPVLDEVTGLPGAPVRIDQVTAIYHQGPANDVSVDRPDAATSATPAAFRLLLPTQLPGPTMTFSQLTATIRMTTGRDIVNWVVSAGRAPDPAQEAIMLAVLNAPDAANNASVTAAARRFAALPAAARHAWLVQNVAGLRAGRIWLRQLP